MSVDNQQLTTESNDEKEKQALKQASKVSITLSFSETNVKKCAQNKASSLNEYLKEKNLKDILLSQRGAILDFHRKSCKINVTDKSGNVASKEGQSLFHYKDDNYKNDDINTENLETYIDLDKTIEKITQVFKEAGITDEKLIAASILTLAQSEYNLTHISTHDLAKDSRVIIKDEGEGEKIIFLKEGKVFVSVLNKAFLGKDMQDNLTDDQFYEPQNCENKMEDVEVSHTFELNIQNDEIQILPVQNTLTISDYKGVVEAVEILKLQDEKQELKFSDDSARFRFLKKLFENKKMLEENQKKFKRYENFINALSSIENLKLNNPPDEKSISDLRENVTTLMKDEKDFEEFLKFSKIVAKFGDKDSEKFAGYIKNLNNSLKNTNTPVINKKLQESTEKLLKKLKKAEKKNSEELNICELEFSRNITLFTEKKIALEKELELYKALNGILKSINDFVSDKFSETEADIKLLCDILKLPYFPPRKGSLSLPLIPPGFLPLEEVKILRKELPIHIAVRLFGYLGKDEEKLYEIECKRKDIKDNIEKQVAINNEITEKRNKIKKLEADIENNNSKIEELKKKGNELADKEYEEYKKKAGEYTSDTINNCEIKAREYEARAEEFKLKNKASEEKAERLEAEAEMLYAHAEKFTLLSQEFEKGSGQEALFLNQAETDKIEASVKRNEAEINRLTLGAAADEMESGKLLNGAENIIVEEMANDNRWVAVYESDVSNIQTQIDRILKEITELDKNIRSEKEELEQYKGSDYVKELRKFKESLNSITGKKSTEVEQKEIQLRHMEGKIISFKLRIERKEIEIKEKKRNLKTKEKNIEDSRQRIKQYKDSANEKLRIAEEKKQAANVVKSRSADKNRTIKEKELEIEVLKTNLQEQRNKIEMQKYEICAPENIKQEIKVLENKNKETRKSISRLNTQVSKLKSQTEELKTAKWKAVTELSTETGIMEDVSMPTKKFIENIKLPILLEESNLLQKAKKQLTEFEVQTQESKKVVHKNTGFFAWLFEKFQDIAGLFFTESNKSDARNFKNS